MTRQHATDSATRYKLTSADDHTHGETQWGAGVVHSGTGKGGLCGSGWIHVYTSAQLAPLLNPSHGSFAEDAHLWRCDVWGELKLDRGLKEGWLHCRTVERIELVWPTREQRIAFGILCAKRVYSDPGWLAWADNWLSGHDRTNASAAAAAVDAAALAACYAAAYAAHAAEADAGAADAADAAENAADAVNLDLDAIAAEAMARS